MNTQRALTIPAFFGATAVILGAFGAHALRNVLPDDRLQTWHTGVEYQFYHTIALFAVVILAKQENKKSYQWVMAFFAMGILFFCGSLYWLALRNLIGMENALWIGVITPVGGMCFIAGWSGLLFSAIKNPNKKK